MTNEELLKESKQKRTQWRVDREKKNAENLNEAIQELKNWKPDRTIKYRVIDYIEAVKEVLRNKPQRRLIGVRMREILREDMAEKRQSLFK